MARTATKAPPRPKPPSPEDEITVTLSRRQVLALETVFQYGIRAAEAYNLLSNTSTAQSAMNALKKAAAGG